MPLECSSVMSLLFLLLITHWTHTYTLRSAEKSLSDHDYAHPIARLRRWSNDHDEIEVPFNETLSSVNHVENQTTVNASENSTLFTADFNSTVENTSVENITFTSPLLKEDRVEDYQTNSTVEITTEVSLLSTVEEEWNSTSNHTMSDKTEQYQLTTTVSINTNETTSDEIEQFQTSSILPSTDSAELTTIPTIDQNETMEWYSLLSNSSAIPNIDEMINTYNLTQKDALIISQDIYRILNETTDNATEASTSTSSTPAMPTCDLSCQCLKECPYGFEILNDTCQCSAPCQNYQCYGNDTCSVTEEGKPLCRPDNGTQHDRPTRCYQPRDAGYHDVNLRYYNRWYYNPEQDACHLFVYRGLGGNENNFLTLHECHLECITCAPSPDPGECLGHITMWYFDKTENTCREFLYSGCKGNENKFLKKELCLDACIHRIYNL